MYDNLHVLQVSLYTPLFSCSCALLCIFGFVSCCQVLVFLKATLTFVCLNMFVIFRINGLKYVNVVQVSLFCSLFVWPLLVCLCCIWWFNRCRSVCRNLLFCAINCIVVHSFCFL